MSYHKKHDDNPVAFLVAHETKDGGRFWKGTMDLGNGKAVKLVMFENHKEGTKSDFIVKGFKKSYKKRTERKQSNW
jgi:hypothetical protein